MNNRKALYILLSFVIVAVAIVPFENLLSSGNVECELCVGECWSVIDDACGLMAINSDLLNKRENSTFLIYIFSQPCSPCNKNTQVWKKIAALSKRDAKAIGIIIDDHQEALAFSEKLKPNFELYVPVDIPKFKDKMKIRTNFAQTILYHDGKVIFVKLGMLQGEDYTHILSTIKHLKQ